MPYAKPAARTPSSGDHNVVRQMWRAPPAHTPRHPGLVPGSTPRRGGWPEPPAAPPRPGGPRTESGVTWCAGRAYRLHPAAVTDARHAPVAQTSATDAIRSRSPTMSPHLHPTHTVTPDSFRSPLCGEGAARASSRTPAARWTPEPVRGDAVCGAGGPPPSDRRYRCAARVSRSLIASPNPSCGIGAIAIPAASLASARCNASNSRAAASVRSPDADSVSSPIIAS